MTVQRGDLSEERRKRGFLCVPFIVHIFYYGWVNIDMSI